MKAVANIIMAVVFLDNGVCYKFEVNAVTVTPELMVDEAPLMKALQL